MIADHPTPKITNSEVSFILNSRDYKGVMIVVSIEDRNIESGRTSRKLQRTGCLQRYVGDKWITE